MIIVNLFAMVFYAIMGYIFLFIRALVKGLNQSDSNYAVLINLIGLIALFCLSIIIFVYAIILIKKLRKTEILNIKSVICFLILIVISFAFNIVLMSINFKSLAWVFYVIFAFLYLVSIVMITGDLIKNFNKKNDEM